jgi:hypothetical protein
MAKCGAPIIFLKTIQSISLRAFKILFATLVIASDRYDGLVTKVTFYTIFPLNL